MATRNLPHLVKKVDSLWVGATAFNTVICFSVLYKEAVNIKVLSEATKTGVVCIDFPILKFADARY